ncbi:hypothetical protein NRB20_16140 [Nocardia sp. RB20]|uniref:Uncharacterized protein n=1 Tax=Nocardia macrotermitis TaxID=2585198 RepID=A0A7K0CYH3_9NOCA|nr:hypothetical protein [Nocardia macrotermitis]
MSVQTVRTSFGAIPIDSHGPIIDPIGGRVSSIPEVILPQRYYVVVPCSVRGGVDA